MMIQTLGSHKANGLVEMDSSVIDGLDLKNNFVGMLVLHGLNCFRDKLLGNAAAAVALDYREHGDVATRPTLPVTAEVTHNRTYHLVAIICLY